MELLGLKKVRDGKYLKSYELTYLNKAGKEKLFEIVSHNEIADVSAIGTKASGVSIIATCNGKMLLLREFRMGVNKRIYNLCAGMIEDGETIEECIARELYEETGLKVAKIDMILPPSYSAVAITDIKTQIAFVTVENDNIDHGNMSINEDISAAFYTKEEVKVLLETEEFSSRAQLAAYYFTCM